MMRSHQTNLGLWNLWNFKDLELVALLVGREGGCNTMKIMDLLLKKPYNKNQLANLLGLDYNTIKHHIRIILKHNYILVKQFDNIIYYVPSDKFFNSLEEYKLLREYLLKMNFD